MSLNQPSVMIISSTQPGDTHVGGVILQDLVHQVGLHRIHCCWLKPSNSENNTYINGLKLTSYDYKYENAWRPIKGITGEFAAVAAMKIKRSPQVNFIAEEILQEINRFKPDIILNILESGISIEVMGKLVDKIRVPISTIVWDDVQHLVKQRNYDRWTGNRLEKTVSHILKKSNKVAVICERMQDVYQSRYGINSIILRHGLPEKLPEASAQKTPEALYRIGFAGSITTPDCIKSLIQTLDQMEWKYNNTEICFRMLGSRFLLDSKVKQRIEYLGWRNASDSARYLGECNFLYLPQTFSEHGRILSELSFPTKLTSYIQTQRPILLHAPDYASLSSFWTKYELGIHVNQLATENLKQAICKMLDESEEDKARWLRNARNAHQQELCMSKFNSAVDELTSYSVN